MSNAWNSLDSRVRLLSVAAVTIALFVLAWWSAGAFGLIEAGSGGPDATVIVEPLPSRTPEPARPTHTPTGTATATSTPQPPEPTATAQPQGELPVAPTSQAEASPAVVSDTPTAPTPPPPPPPPPSGSLAGLRVWSNGDSTSYFMSVSFINQAANAGAVPTQAEPEYQISSGLLRPEFFDWPAYLASEMASKDPDVVVFMVGANDAYVGMPLDSYRQRVAAVMDQLSDRRVIWVGQPNMGRADLAAAIPAMNEVYAQEAAARPWVRYVDAWALTSDGNGAYAQYLPDETGTPRQIRADDGVHLTAEGGRRLANAVIAAILGG